jgi:hypothetical protein
MTDPTVYVRVEKRKGKSWWTATFRFGTRKYELDFYMLGARFRIASLTEELERTKRNLEQVEAHLDEYRDRYGYSLYNEQSELYDDEEH